MFGVPIQVVADAMFSALTLHDSSASSLKEIHVVDIIHKNIAFFTDYMQYNIPNTIGAQYVTPAVRAETKPISNRFTTKNILTLAVIVTFLFIFGYTFMMFDGVTPLGKYIDYLKRDVELHSDSKVQHPEYAPATTKSQPSNSLPQMQTSYKTSPNVNQLLQVFYEKIYMVSNADNNNDVNQ